MRFLRALPTLGLAALLPLATTAGCYRYVPAAGELPAGTRVRLAFTADGAERMAATVGDGVASVDGELVRDARDTLTVLVRSLGTERGDMSVQGTVPVAVPRDALASVARRTLDKPVTVVVLLVGGGILVGLANLIQTGGDGGGTPPGTEPPIQP